MRNGPHDTWRAPRAKPVQFPQRIGPLMGRYPRSVYGAGSEPDVRFTMANERTYLAWVRTSLALLAAGTALELLGLDLHPGYRLAASLLLIATGIVVPILAFVGWMRSERALRHDEPLPASPLGIVLAVAVVGAGILVLAGVLAR